MQKTNSTQSAQKAHRKVQVSTMRSRRDLCRPSKSTPLTTEMSKPKHHDIKVDERSKKMMASKPVKKVMITEQEETMSQMSSWDDMVAEQDTSMKHASSWDAMGQNREEMPANMQVRTRMQRFDDMSEEVDYSDGMQEQQMEPMPQRRIMHHADMMSPMQAVYQQEAAEQEEMEHIPHPIQRTVKERMDARRPSTSMQAPAKMSAREMKEQAIQKAVASAQTVTKKEKTKKKMNIGFGRVLLAMACATAAVFAIVYFVNLNMPDISLKVAALQTGIQASYPSYVPRDYSLSNITSESGKVTINFINANSGDYFTITEEQSSWDSNALLNNYVKDTYEENYDTIREQGLTIYVSGSNATWVNGGVVYKLASSTGSLTKKQIKAIAVSL